MLGRLCIAMDDLAAEGRHECLPPETYGKVLFSEANKCHPAYCELERQSLSRHCVVPLLRHQSIGFLEPQLSGAGAGSVFVLLWLLFSVLFRLVMNRRSNKGAAALRWAVGRFGKLSM